SGAFSIRDQFDRLMAADQNTDFKKGDVLYLDGGADINPVYYGEKPNPMTYAPNRARDASEKLLFRNAQIAGIGVLGICRGAQMACILSGGKLHQHVTRHTMGHYIYTKEGTCMVDGSSHHQVMYLKDVEHDLIAWANHAVTVFDEYEKSFDDYHQ